MHLVTVSPSAPDPGTGGGGNWGISLIRHLVAQGHQVTHVAVVGEHDLPRGIEAIRERYDAMGVRLIEVPFEPMPADGSTRIGRLLDRLLRPGPDTVWRMHRATRRKLASILDSLRPDCVIGFAFAGLTYFYGYRGAPVVGFQAEAPHINTYVRWRYCEEVAPGFTPARLLYSLRALVRYYAERKANVALLRWQTVAGHMGPHYVRWAERQGLGNAEFLTTPTPDPVGADWLARREAAPRNERCRILLIGHLHSTSNRSGLPLFFDEILPALQREWGEDNYEVHVVGRASGIPARFVDHPGVIWRGPVYPADEEFLRCDVLLVPIPAPTGSRVRIINGFTYGCCVVGHSANALGIPELVHEENILMAERGADIARLVMRAAADPALRARLGRNGRAVYERHYSEAEGGRQLLAQVERARRLHATSGQPEAVGA